MCMQNIGLGSRRAKKKIDTSGMAGVADVADLDSAWRLRRRRERQCRVLGRRSIFRPFCRSGAHLAHQDPSRESGA